MVRSELEMVASCPALSVYLRVLVVIPRSRKVFVTSETAAATTDTASTKLMNPDSILLSLDRLINPTKGTVEPSIGHLWSCAQIIFGACKPLLLDQSNELASKTKDLSVYHQR